MNWILSPPTACVFGLLAVSSQVFAAEPVDYLRDVKPLLTTHCVSCHGATKPGPGCGSTRPPPRSGVANGRAVVPGQGDESP